MITKNLYEGEIREQSQSKDDKEALDSYCEQQKLYSICGRRMLLTSLVTRLMIEQQHRSMIKKETMENLGYRIVFRLILVSIVSFVVKKTIDEF